MTKYVALSCDANPLYSIWAPLMVRFWRRLGYTPILFQHNDGWSTELAMLVDRLLDEEHLRGETIVVKIPRIGPLSIGNTMRVSRVAASAVASLSPTDFILTSDIDMAPLSRTFFDRDPEQCWVLRGDMYGSFEGASAMMHDGTKGLIAGLWRFPLCYIGMPVFAWRTIMPIVVGDAEKSIRNINHGLRQDAHDHDEACTSARLLLSAWAAGSLEESHVVEVDGGKRWFQGALNLVAQTDWPKGQPSRMLLGGQATKHNPRAVDWHIKSTGKWIGPALAAYWPEERDFINEYWPRACKAIGVTT